VKVLILSGPPGYGKSTYVEALNCDKQVVSADTFFMKDGVYCYSPLQVGEAHRACLRLFNLVASGTGFQKPDLLIVDNTNVSLVEMAPYIRIAQAYGYEVEIHAFRVLRKNVHGVPHTKVLQMSDQHLLMLENDACMRYSDVVDGQVLQSKVFRCPVIVHAQGDA